MNTQMHLKKMKNFFNTNDSNYVFQKESYIKKTIPFKDLIGFIKSFKIEISTFSDTIIIAVYSDDLNIEDAFIIQIFGLFLVPLFRFAFKMELFLKGQALAIFIFVKRKRTGVLLLDLL